MNLSVFTSTCYYCHKRTSAAEEVFCVECYGNLPTTYYGFSESNAVMDRFKGLLPVKNAGAFLYYHKTEMVKEILKQIKYNQNTSLAIQMGRIAGSRLKDSMTGKIDLIIPVPLHDAKQRQRGYNQTAFFGQGLSEELGIPQVINCLKRMKNTGSQTQFNRDLRFINVENVFELTDQTRIKAKNILLIDDVITTGATLESAGNAILKADPKSINIFTMASAFEL